MENIRLIDNYQPNGGGVDNIIVIYDRENDKICFEIPSLYEFVDLGLPSGTKWASYNIGATKPEEVGLYFAWGETQGYSIEDVNNGIKHFYWDDYKFSIDGSSTNFSKYNKNDGIVTLEKIDDAAYQSDNKYIIPSKADFEELFNNTTMSIINDYNNTSVKGFKFTSNDNEIFFPLSGTIDNGELLYDTTHCWYWTSTNNKSIIYRSYYCGINFNTGNKSVVNSDRYGGLPIRPIKK